MKVWEVGISDCESSYTICICSTKEIALREMFKKRDELIAEWMEAKVREEVSTKEFLEKQAKAGIHYGLSSSDKSIYDNMILALSSNDYENWNNYPHDRPWIRETTIIEV